MQENIDVVLPVEKRWAPLVRLVIGGVASTTNMSLVDIEDLRIAVEQLLYHAAKEDSVRLRFSFADHSLRVEIGALKSEVIAKALQTEDDQWTDLRHVLGVLVDSFGVTAVDGESVWVRLEKSYDPVEES